MIAWSGHATSLKQACHLRHIRIALNMTFGVNIVMHYTARFHAALCLSQFTSFATLNATERYCMHCKPQWWKGAIRTLHVQSQDICTFTDFLHSILNELTMVVTHACISINNLIKSYIITFQSEQVLLLLRVYFCTFCWQKKNDAFVHSGTDTLPEIQHLLSN